jgi:hypothetical protein
MHMPRHISVQILLLVPIMQGSFTHFALQDILGRLVKEHAQRGPLHYLQGIAVEQVRLGDQPPVLLDCRARHSPSEGLLQLDIGFHFEPVEGFSVVVGCDVKSIRPQHLINAYWPSCIHCFWETTVMLVPSS